MQVVTGRGGGGGAVGAADLAPSVYTHKGHFEIRGEAGREGGREGGREAHCT